MSEKKNYRGYMEIGDENDLLSKGFEEESSTSGDSDEITPLTELQKSYMKERSKNMVIQKNVIGDYEKFVFEIPDTFDNYFAHFDAYFTTLCQFFSHPLIIATSKICCIFVSVEFCCSIPLYFYLIGEDWLAFKAQYVYFFGAFFSQFIKRFFYRKRPADHVPPRAIVYGQLMSREKTSSFPCRDTIFSILNSYMIGIVLNYYFNYTEFFGWGIWIYTPTIMLMYSLLIMFCRVNLGVQHPSDCALAILIAGVILTIDETFFYFISMRCPYPPECYAHSHPMQYDAHWRQMNYFLASGIAAVLLIIVLIFSAKPIEFYTKFHFVFGILFACITFNYLFLCKKFSLDGKSSLGAPINLPQEYYSYFFAAFFPLLLFAVNLFYVVVKKRKFLRSVVSMVLFIFTFVASMAIMIVWRIVILA